MLPSGDHEGSASLRAVAVIRRAAGAVERDLHQVVIRLAGGEGDPVAEGRDRRIVLGARPFGERPHPIAVEVRHPQVCAGCRQGTGREHDVTSVGKPREARHSRHDVGPAGRAVAGQPRSDRPAASRTAIRAAPAPARWSSERPRFRASDRPARTRVRLPPSRSAPSPGCRRGAAVTGEATYTAAAPTTSPCCSSRRKASVRPSGQIAPRIASSIDDLRRAPGRTDGPDAVAVPRARDVIQALAVGRPEGVFAVVRRVRDHRRGRRRESPREDLEHAVDRGRVGERLRVGRPGREPLKSLFRRHRSKSKRRRPCNRPLHGICGQQHADACRTEPAGDYPLPCGPRPPSWPSAAFASTSPRRLRSVVRSRSRSEVLA